MKFTVSLMLSLLFLVVLSVVYIVHVNYLKVNVVFYAALQDVFISVVIMSILIFSVLKIKSLNIFEKELLVIVWGLTGYCLAISVPTVIDRSLSFYILEKISQRGGGIRLENFEDVFVKEYLHEHRLVDVRLTEQQQSGTIIINDGCVNLTEKGQLISEFSRFFRQSLLPKQRLLMGEYSDDLTDPFRESIGNISYGC